MVIVVAAEVADVLGLQEFDAEAFGLLAQAAGEVDTRDAFGEAGHVVELFGACGLSADGGSFDDEGIYAFSCGVNCRCQSCRAAAHNDEVIMAATGTGFEAKFNGKFSIARFCEMGTIFKDKGGNDAFATVGFDDELLCLQVLFDIDPVIGNLVFAEKLFAAAAVGAPMGAP